MITPQKLAQVNAGRWAILNSIKLQRSVYTFCNHEYQVEPMGNICKRVCYMKATRGGFSEIEILKSLHGMIYGRYEEGVLYLFPTTDDVNEFSKSRFAPLLSSNQLAIGKYVKSGGKGTDTASLKKIHNAFLYLRGARLSEKRGEQAESSKMKSIGVDKIVFDEVDHMDEEVIAKARGRYYDSPWQEEVFIGNPIIPGLGIDQQWQKSDQRYWERECNNCTGIISTPVATTSLIRKTCAELFFLEDPERCVGVRKNGTGYIACKNCGREVFMRDGIWEPSLSDNTNYMKGYRWSQLTSAVCDPLEILHDFREPPEGNIADVYRLRLGLPYIAAEDRLVESQVYECCGIEEMRPSYESSCAMGVDVGKIKHIEIGIKTGKEQYKLLKVARLSSWDDIHILARKFHVKSSVVDIRPYEDSAKDFQNNARKYGNKVFLCEYKENTPRGTIYNEKTGIVCVHRTEIFDATHRMTVTPGMLTIPRYCPEIKEFAKQMCGAYKILEPNKKTGVSVYRYKGSNEHYRNGLNYFKLAADRSRIVRAGTVHRKKEKVISNYARI